MALPTSMYGLNYGGGGMTYGGVVPRTAPLNPATSATGGYTGTGAGVGAAPPPIKPGTTVNSPFGQQTYGPNGASTFTGSSATATPTTAPTTTTPSGPNAYNPATTYPGPYANNADNYKVWFNNQNGGSIAPPPPGTDPNAQAGSSPYMALATGNGPTGQFSLNSQNYATPQYAQQVANATGGSVTQATPYAPGSPFYQNQPQNLVTEGNGNVINPAILAQLYSHGYSQSYVNQLAQNYMNGTDAYNPNVQNTLGQNSWGYGTNTPVTASQSFQAGTAPNAQVLSQNPTSIGNGFLGSGQTVVTNPATYTTQNPNPPNPNYVPNTPLAQNVSPQNNNMDLSSLISYLTSPQIQSLYGGNPFQTANSAIGNGNLGAIMGALTSNNSGNSGNNLYNIAALLNLFGAGQSQSSNGNLNPLFFNNSSQVSPQMYYPQFY